MLNKKGVVWILIFWWSCMMLSQQCHANLTDEFGQIIHIQTNFRRLCGSARLSLIVRDLDNNRNIPYLFEINQPKNTWLISTHSRNYVILSSSLQIIRYKPSCNQFKNYRIYNFCQLESCGRIMRNRSMSVIITGDLSPHPYTYSCQVTRHPPSGFTIVTIPDCPCPIARAAVVPSAAAVVPGAAAVVPGAAAAVVPAAAAAAVPGTATVVSGAPETLLGAAAPAGLPVQVAAPITAAPLVAAAPAPTAPIAAAAPVIAPQPVISGPPIVATPVAPQAMVSAPRAQPLVVTPPQPTLPTPLVARNVGGPPPRY